MPVSNCMQNVAVVATQHNRRLSGSPSKPFNPAITSRILRTKTASLGTTNHRLRARKAGHRVQMNAEWFRKHSSPGQYPDTRCASDRPHHAHTAWPAAARRRCSSDVTRRPQSGAPVAISEPAAPRRAAYARRVHRKYISSGSRRPATGGIAAAKQPRPASESYPGRVR